MKRRIRAAVCLLGCWLMWSASLPTMAAGVPVTTTEKVGFVYRNRAYRQKMVTFYNDVYAYNHTEYGLQPFDGSIPARFFVVDGNGMYALAPIVLDVVDAVRIALYGGDVGKAALYYGQYTEKILSSKLIRSGKTYASKRWGWSGIHEGLDFIAETGQPIHAILEGVVLCAGRGKDNTLSIYNEEYNVTILYLHTRGMQVRSGDYVAAGTLVSYESKRGAGDYYTHIEVRFGRHTSPHPYGNAVLESDLPYDLFMRALNVTPSGRDPITAENVLESERMRKEAEAAAQAAREAAEAEALRLANPTPSPTPRVVILDGPRDDLPTDFGFATPSATPKPTPSP